MELNFFTATQAHQKWKTRLFQCICEDERTGLDPYTIAMDNRCDLGKWLHAVNGRRPNLSPGTRSMFSRLMQEHAEFHRVAASTVELSLQGRKDEALKNIQGGPYSRISNKVIGTLGELYLKRKEFGMA